MEVYYWASMQCQYVGHWSPGTMHMCMYPGTCDSYRMCRRVNTVHMYVRSFSRDYSTIIFTYSGPLYTPLHLHMYLRSKHTSSGSLSVPF